MTDATVTTARRPWAKFVIPSLIGAFVYLCPIPRAGSFTIPFGVALDWINDGFGALVAAVLIGVTVISAVLTVAASWLGMGPGQGVFAQVFRVTPVWVVLRALGAVFCVMYFAGIGPDFVLSDATGGTVVGFLMKNLLALFLLAALTLPLLTDYGMMEFVGVFASGLFRRLFRLPGRAAIDGLASWLASAPVGVMLTVQQYRNGVYTRREAATVATTFSIVSVPFCYVIAKVVGLEGVFLSYYASVVVIGIVCALIQPRIPPLSWFPDTFAPGTAGRADDLVRPGETLLQAGTRMGLDRAARSAGFGAFLRAGLRNLVDIWFGLVPATLAIAMIAMIVAEYTPLFQWLSLPFVPLLEVFGLEEARQAAPSLVIGFADMYLPALIGADISSQETRFLIAILSVSQLIYMSEVGALLLRADIGLKIRHLVMLFLIRTAIATPLAIALAKIVL